MFTGIITHQGHISSWEPHPKGGRFVVTCEEVFEELELGESIAVNGCCLTVVEFQGPEIAFDVSDETLRKTAFGQYANGQLVNLERALRLQDRLGGHLVSGHVDTVGKISARTVEEGSERFVISFDPEWAKLLIEKGSVCIDGISLTVCDLTDQDFAVYIIPHTLEKTHLQGVGVGTSVNLEFDLVGKYILRGQNLENSKS